MSQTSSRKSSLGANSRRGPQKAHIPYRGDDLQHGKKTGKTVNQVSRDADDFEPFEQVLDQAYKGGNAPRPANGKSKAVNGHSYRELLPIQDVGDDSGELSMDIDSTNNSPTAYFNAAAAPQPSSAKRVGSSSRPLPRGSTVDYDQVPSPKPVPRRSSVNSGTNSQPFRPSRLRMELQDDEDVARSPNADPDDGSFSRVGVDDEQGYPVYPGDDDYPENDDTSPNPRGNLSFTALAQDEEDNFPEGEEEEVDLSPSPARADKGKGRATVHVSDGEEDTEVEEDIAAGLQDIEEAYDDEDEPGPSKKKIRRNQDKSPSDTERSKRSKKPQRKRTKEKPRISTYETLNDDGLRRSKRRHYPPLEYWRQEKVVWGRRDSGRSVVPVIKAIVRLPKAEPEPLGSKKRKRGGTHAPRSKSKSFLSPNPQPEEVQVENPELGWDDETGQMGVIMDYHSNSEVERRVAFTSKMLAPKTAQASNYKFQKVFGDGDFIAAGQLIIPPGEEKPAKPAKDNTYIFYVIEGAVECKVHRASFILATGGMFLVPRGNQYYIKNICQRDVRIFFAQARKIQESNMDAMPDVLPRESAPSRARTAPRSSSHSARSPKQPAPATQDTAAGSGRPEKV